MSDTTGASEAESSGSVLIADDDPAIRQIASAFLSAEGYLVHEAANGMEALSQAADRRPDLVLLDIVMPGSDGLRICRRLRGMPAGRTIPIVMLTGSDDTASIDGAYEAGADDFVVKPPNWSILTRRIKHLIRTARVAESLRRTEAQRATAFRLARLGWWELDFRQRRFRCSEDFRRILGAGKLETFSEFLALIHPQDRDKLTCLTRAGGEETEQRGIEVRVLDTGRRIQVLNQEALITRDPGGQPLNVLVVAQDVTRQKQKEERIRVLAGVDPVTSLANRRRLDSHLQVALGLAEQHGRTLAVLFLDLDGFKRINDSMGHATGDRILRETGDRLMTLIRKSDLVVRGTGPASESFVARFGGDEFVVILSEIAQAGDAALVAERIVEAMSASFNIDGHEIFLNVSIGIATYPADGADSATLLKHADTAMYAMKESGGSGHRTFTEPMGARVRNQVQLENELRLGLERNEFVLYYQPKLSVRTGLISSAEALLRWERRGGEIVPPDRFLPICEERRLIIPLGRWVLKEVCHEIQRWSRLGASGFRVAVNVSPRQLNEPEFIRTVSDPLEASGIDPSCLELEVTESALLADAEASGEVLWKLKKLGVRIALDDFGTGYSSLSLLRRLPFDAIKIDQSFTRGIPHDQECVALTTAILALGQTLGMEVIAEGVESEEQRRFLGSLGCDEMQGFLISRPLPAQECFGLLSPPSLPGTSGATPPGRPSSAP